jgi:hypothetical protein
MFRMEQQWTAYSLYCNTSTTAPLIFYWAAPVCPSNMPIATWESSQLDKRLHHAGNSLILSWPRRHRYSQVAQGSNSSRRPWTELSFVPRCFPTSIGVDPWRSLKIAFWNGFYFTTCTLRTRFVVRGGYVHILTICRILESLLSSSASIVLWKSYLNSLPRG